MINTDNSFVFNMDALVNIGHSINKWSGCAIKNNIDIRKQITKIVEIIIQAPSFDNSRIDEDCEAALNCMREILIFKNIKEEFLTNTLKIYAYCYQHIHNSAIGFVEEKLETPNNEISLIAENEVLLNQQILFQSLYCNQIIRKIAIKCIKENLEETSLIATNKLLFKIYEAKLWKKLPPKRCLSTIATIETAFTKIIKLIEKMKNEIHLDNLGINVFNQCNGCGSGSNSF